ncbi:uncharacterized protein LOC100211098 isoform X1 [Hydra vulgaris]|uniref:uncharacterized protein LOC100211098 isoform X1 n=1 Tax=Hydra vulgaris TaxID=6087 RepID=UPI001F5EBC3E|nr:uncharacterized protein LOC100211098 isoform X1 [Hydra vulgaris]
MIFLVFFLFVVAQAKEYLIGNAPTLLEKGKLIAEIPKLDKEYLISFDINPNKFVAGWHSVVHFTIGSNVANYGDRVPGIWFHEDAKGGLHIAAPINGNANRYFNTKPIGKNVWSNIEISQVLKIAVYVYTIKINGETVFSEINNQAQFFNNVKVYASDPWYDVQDGSIKNLYIINGVIKYLIGDAPTLLVKGKLIAEIPKLDKEYLISLDINPNKFVAGWHSVVHFTIGSNVANYGDRVPGIWFHEDAKGGLHIAAPINGNANRYFNTKPIGKNVWSNIEISQVLKGVVYLYTIKIKGKIVFSEINNQAQYFDNVKVYASDPWYDVQDGSIKNLYIINGVIKTGFQPVIILPTDYIHHIKEFALIPSALLGTLYVLKKEYTVLFKLKPKKYSKGWKNVLHMTLGKDYGTYGDRNPGVWFHEDGSGKLAIFAAVSGNVNYYVETTSLPLKAWSYLKIYQSFMDGKYWFSVDLNGINIHRVENTDARDFKTMKVYASDPWYAAQEGLINDLFIINGKAEYLVGNIHTPLIKGKVIAEIPKLDKEYLISFDVIPNKFVAGWHSVVHFTIGSNIENYGDRVPGIWFNEDAKGGLHIAAPINGNVNRYFNTKPIGLNVWSNIEISQILKGAAYVYTIKINGEMVFFEINNQAQYFDNVKVYASDPWYEVQDGSIRNLFLSNGPSSNVLLPSPIILPRDFIDDPSEIVIKRNNLIATIVLLKRQFSVSFELKPSLYKTGWHSVFHMTIGQNVENYGDRNPGVWFNNDGSGKLHIAFSINGNSNYFFTTKSSLPLNVWSKIEIFQRLEFLVYVFEVKINENVVFTINNNDARDFKNVKVYVSDPWYDAQPGLVKNVKIINSI